SRTERAASLSASTASGLAAGSRSSPVEPDCVAQPEVNTVNISSRLIGSPSRRRARPPPPPPPPGARAPRSRAGTPARRAGRAPVGVADAEQRGGGPLGIAERHRVDVGAPGLLQQRRFLVERALELARIGGELHPLVVAEQHLALQIARVRRRSGRRLFRRG